MLTRADIAALIPHAGHMCLLDSVESWDSISLICRTNSHRSADNPLRVHDRLSSIHLIEYAAQATAVHGGLLASSGNQSQHGLLAAVREVKLDTDYLETLHESLVLCATRLFASPLGCMYKFTAHSGGRELASGRLSVMIPGTSTYLGVLSPDV